VLISLGLVYFGYQLGTYNDESRGLNRALELAAESEQQEQEAVKMPEFTPSGCLMERNDKFKAELLENLYRVMPYQIALKEVRSGPWFRRSE
jgi:hypothetical protein